MSQQIVSQQIERVAVVGGARTPFVKAGTSFSGFSMKDLGAHALSAAIKRCDLDPQSIDQVIFSTVLLDPRLPNWAREIVFAAGLPKTLYAYSVSNNCISGLVALTSAAENISLGRSSCAIAGGSESMSQPVLLFGNRATKKFLSLNRARSLGERLSLATRFRPKDFAPKPPSPTEPSTGLTMGQHMEITAQKLAIAREAQDELALLSHQRAAAATDDGTLTASIAPLANVNRDKTVRGDTSLEKLAKLKPVFDRSEKGTLTAGNSSPLTDGASAVVLMSESRAKSEGREALAFVKDYEYTAIDPEEGLLMAPTVAVPRLLERNNLSFADFDYIEVHEAFSAQVLANLQVWESGALGTVNREKMNTWGGSVAIGHPFAATGGRIVTTLAEQMAANNAKRGLVSICAAGAMAGALILERD